MKAYVYWLHLPEHTDMKSEGYISVAVDHNKRFKDHKKEATKRNHINPHLQAAFRKYGDQIQKHVIWLGEETDCYKNEEILRPKEYIGWNINKGGSGGFGYINKNGLATGRKTSMVGKNNPMFGKNHKEESLLLMKKNRKGKGRQPKSNEIRKKINWSPKIIRTPPIQSKTVKDIRGYLRSMSEERK